MFNGTPNNIRTRRFSGRQVRSLAPGCIFSASRAAAPETETLLSLRSPGDSDQQVAPPPRTRLAIFYLRVRNCELLIENETRCCNEQHYSSVGYRVFDSALSQTNMEQLDLYVNFTYYVFRRFSTFDLIFYSSFKTRCTCGQNSLLSGVHVKMFQTNIIYDLLRHNDRTKVLWQRRHERSRLFETKLNDYALNSN